MTTSLLYVCLDGLGDDPIPEFDGRTPLEAAETPNLDALAARGRTGTVVTVGPGIAPESDIGVFGILGYDPHEEHPGRGVLEALGVGMDFRDGDLAYRVNFATADGSEIIDRRVGRDLSSDEAAKLADEVNRTLSLPGASFELRATIEHRGALVIRTDDGAALSAEVTNTDPAYRRDGHLGVALETFEPRVVTAEALAESVGIASARHKTLAFVASCFFCGLMGAIHCHYLRFVSPFVFTFFFSTDLVIFNMVGGLGSFWGPLAGSVLLTALGEQLFAAGYYKSLVYALVLLVVILALPGGLIQLPRAREAWAARRLRLAKAPVTAVER